jgi:hypothetical protein
MRYSLGNVKPLLHEIIILKGQRDMFINCKKKSKIEKRNKKCTPSEDRTQISFIKKPQTTHFHKGEDYY